MHACFVFWISLDSLQVSLCLNIFSLQSTAASIGISTHVQGFFELHVIRIKEMNASQLSSIVELRC